jgi:hypothetical protein
MERIMRLLAAGLFTALALVVFGCALTPRPPDYGGEDGGKIARLVDDLNDDANTVPKLKAAFAAGTPVGRKEAKAYPQYRFEMKGNPSVTGDTATATIEVCRHSATEGGRDMQWTFVKEGDRWRIRSAPLP